MCGRDHRTFLHASTLSCPYCSWNLNKIYTKRQQKRHTKGQYPNTSYLSEILYVMAPCSGWSLAVVLLIRCCWVLCLLTQRVRCYSRARFFLSLMCSPQTLLVPVCSTSECYVSCSEYSLFVRAISAGTLKVRRLFLCFGGGAVDVRLRQNVCSLSPQDKWAPPTPKVQHTHTHTQPMYLDIPRCSQTSCGQSPWQARETRSHSVINHPTLRCVACLPVAPRWTAIPLLERKLSFFPKKNID